jgi:hypothetical protein
VDLPGSGAGAAPWYASAGELGAVGSQLLFPVWCALLAIRARRVRRTILRTELTTGAAGR